MRHYRSDACRWGRTLPGTVHRHLGSQAASSSLYEDKWRSSGITIDQDRFRAQRKADHFSAAISEISGNSHSLNCLPLWVTFFYRKKELGLPCAQQLPAPANAFRSHFRTKIAKIRDEIDTLVRVPLPLVDTKPVETRLTNFALVTPSEVVKLVKQSLTKSCSVDPIPTSLVKKRASTLALNCNS